MRRSVVRSVVVTAVAVLCLGTGVGAASASTGGGASGPDDLLIDEIPEQQTTVSTCRIVENQGSSGYGMLSRSGVTRVYEFAGYSTDEQGYRSLRANVYEDDGNWFFAGGWSKGDLLGYTFMNCS